MAHRLPNAFLTSPISCTFCFISLIISNIFHNVRYLRQTEDFSFLGAIYHITGSSAKLVPVILGGSLSLVHAEWQQVEPLVNKDSRD